MAKRPVQLTMQMGRLATSHWRRGALRRKEAIGEALRRALDGCTTVDGRPLDRETVSTELSRLVGENVSVHAINNWVAEGKDDRRIPLEYAEALTLITGDRGILDAALGHYRVLDEEEVGYLELGRIVAEERKRAKEKRRVLEKLKA
ncbi:MAG: hypothetical protein ABFD97_12870 [Syntrophobacter sp.]